MSNSVSLYNAEVPPLGKTIHCSSAGRAWRGVLVHVFTAKKLPIRELFVKYYTDDGKYPLMRKIEYAFRAIDVDRLVLRKDSGGFVILPLSNQMNIYVEEE